MKARTLLIGAALLSSLLTVACKDDHGHGEKKADVPDAAAGHQESQQGVVHVAKEAIVANDIRIEKATAGRLAGGVDAPAEVTFQPDQVAHVTLLVPGRIAAVGTASLWMAIAADMGASLIVFANALRLLGDSPGGPKRRS